VDLAVGRRREQLHAVAKVLLLPGQHDQRIGGERWVSMAVTKIACGTVANAGTLLWGRVRSAVHRPQR
jgi:hypothetical protein